MTIEDLVKVLDSAPLGAYPWGADVVTMVNAYLPESSKITLKTDGVELCRAIGKLPDPIRDYLLSRRLDRSTSPAPLPWAPEKPSAPFPSEPPPNLPPQNPHHPDRFQTGYTLKFRPVVVLIVGITMVLMAGMTAMRISDRTTQAIGITHVESKNFLTYAIDVLRTIRKDMGSEDKERGGTQEAPPSSKAPASSSSAGKASSTNFKTA